MDIKISAMKEKNWPGSTGYLGLFLAIVISILFTLFTFNIDFIRGDSLYWAIEGTDVSQHVTGIAMYLSNGWHFPLLALDSLNYPEGTRITFVDGIPAYSLLLKTFLSHSDRFINPLGYWIVLCVLLQGFSAWWIARELEINSWLCLIFLVLVLLTFPAWMMRLKHAALMSHWLILFSIALYVRGNRLQQFPVLGWVLLIFLSFYIHIYLFAMVLGIYLASIFNLKPKFNVQQIFMALLPLIILGLSLYVFLLPLPPFSLTKEIGFEKYGLSLFSPFTGGDIIHWQINMTEGQKEEGFPYLGLGVILAFIYAVFTQITECKKLIKGYLPLFIMLLLYFIYALSDHIYFEDKLLIVIKYPSFLDFVTGELRYAARFFWPVGYAIIIFSTFFLYKRLSQFVFSALLCVLLIIQLVDVREYYFKFKIKAHGHQNHHIIDFNAVDNFLGKHIKHLYVYPKYKCTIKPFRNNVLLSVARYAAARNFTVNTGYIARYQPICTDSAIEIKQSDHKQSGYIFMKDEYANQQAVFRLMGTAQQFVCKEVSDLYLCKYLVNK